MPLIAEPEHGTFYGVMGQRSPQPAELKALQDACEGDMNMMRHCRQCRADAVGLLGEDRGAEFTLDKIDCHGDRLRGGDGPARRVARPDCRRAGGEKRAQGAPAGDATGNATGDQLPAARREAGASARSAGADGGGGQKRAGRRALRARPRVPRLRSLGQRRPPGRPPQGGVLLRGRRELRRCRVGAGENDQRTRRLRSRALRAHRLRTLGPTRSGRHPAQRRTRHAADRGCGAWRYGTRCWRPASWPLGPIVAKRA
jgi:hypothetical protein